jgi:RimJ/RimL family protein N-acetyltransferase
MIVGEKATLLPFDEAYVARVHAWINSEDVRWGTGTEGPVSDFAHRRWYERTMNDSSQRVFIVGQGSGHAAIPVGVIGLRHLDLRTRAAEYWMYLGEPQARGQGVARSASELLLSFGFGTLGLNRIYLVVNENNEPAIALYKRLGFVQEGICREACFQQGRFIDRFLFSILAAEFRNSQTSMSMTVEA